MSEWRGFLCHCCIVVTWVPEAMGLWCPGAGWSELWQRGVQPGGGSFELGEDEDPHPRRAHRLPGVPRPTQT